MRFFRSYVTALLFLLPSVLAVSCSPVPDSNPNIAFFVYDCTRHDRYSINGNSRKTSPFFDSLAGRSIYFRRGVAPATWTFPSHAAMFTGFRNHQLKVDIANKNYLVLDPNVATMAELLAEHGYTTISFPDHFYFGPVNASLSRGFRYFDIIFNPMEQPALSFTNCYGDLLIDRYVTIPADNAGALEKLKEEYRERLKENVLSIDELDRSNEKFPDVRELIAESGYMDFRYKALHNILEKNKQSPLFFYFNLHSSPFRRTNQLMDAKWFFKYLEANNLRYVDPARFDSVSEEDSIEKGLLRQDYVISFYDAVCEKLTRYLKSQVSGQMAVIISSDHGEAHCEHGESIYKHTYALPWEYAVKAPLLIHLPDDNESRRGIVVEEPVSLADVFYTVLDIAGVGKDYLPSKGLVGRSLLERVQKKDFEEYEVAESFSRFPYAEIASIVPELGNEYYFERETSLSGNAYAIYKGDYKLIYIPSCTETVATDPRTSATPGDRASAVKREFEVRMLFNLKSDPDEMVDLSGEFPEIVEGFLDFYERHKEREANVRLVNQKRLGYDMETARQIRAMGYVE